MTRDELQIAFEFISNTLDDIYSDVAFLDVVQPTTRDFPNVQKRALDKIITIADFADKYLNRLDSKEKIQ